MIVRLSELDTYEIAWAAAGRCQYKREAGIVNSKRVDQNRDDYQITREGLSGEWAVAKVLGLPVNLENYLGGDPGWDFEYYGIRVDVKTSRAKYLLFRNMDQFKADCAIYAKYLNEYQVDLMGFVSKEEFTEKHLRLDFGYGFNCVMDGDELNDIRDFL